MSIQANHTTAKCCNLLLCHMGCLALLSTPEMILNGLNFGITDPEKKGGSVAEWLACSTQAQKGPDSNRSRDGVG